MTIKPSDVVKLRQMTGAGMMNAKAALEQSDGNIEKAVEHLRKKGEATAAKKADRTTEQGLIESYVHVGKIGVLVELGCETDFVARTEDFKNLAHDLAMQIAANNPTYLAAADVPAEVLDKESELIRAQAEGKDASVIDRIVEGKLDKFYSEVCLLAQPFLKDPAISVQKHLTAVIAKLGENITIVRFTRYALGESS